MALKALANTKGFSDVVNSYNDPIILRQIYNEIYLNSKSGIEALINWTEQDDINISFYRKKPMKFKTGLITDPDAFNATTNKIVYTQPEYVQEYRSLQKNLEIGRQYAKMDKQSIDLINKELNEAVAVRKQLKKEAMMEELQKEAIEISLPQNSTAYDIWEAISVSAEKLNMSQTSLFVIVRSSVLYQWRRLKVFDGEKVQPFTLNVLNSAPVRVEGGFIDTISGVTFFSVPDEYLVSDMNGNEKMSKLFNENVKAVFWEDNTSYIPLRGMKRTHTPLRLGDAPIGSGYGDVKMLEGIEYFDAAVMDQKKCGQITVQTDAEAEEQDEKTKLNKTIADKEKTIADLTTKLADTKANNEKEKEALNKQLKEANELIEAMDQPSEQQSEAVEAN